MWMMGELMFLSCLFFDSFLWQNTSKMLRSFDLCTFRLRNCVILILNFDPQFQKLHQFGTEQKSNLKTIIIFSSEK